MINLKHRTCKGILCLVLFLLQVPAWGSAAGVAGASFLEIPVGAGPSALGSAYSALATDAYAPTWNPAGLGFVSFPQLATQYVSYLASISEEYASFVYPVESGKAVGLSAQYVGTGDIAGTEVGGTPTGNFSSHYAAYSVAYGQRLTRQLSLGLTVKLINAQISDVAANAYAADAGALYRVQKDLSLAATVTNAGTKLRFLSTGDSLPLAVHVAAAYVPVFRWLVTTEGIFYSQAGPASFRGGLQWCPLDVLALRMGYRTDDLQGLSPVAGFSAGMGVTVWGQELDYAWVPVGDLGNVQYVSLVFKFGGKEGNVIEAADRSDPHT